LFAGEIMQQMHEASHFPDHGDVYPYIGELDSSAEDVEMAPHFYVVNSP
jgi:hypothetical protein